MRAYDRELGEIWDPIAGDYVAADGWIRLHTNFRAHRAAALRVLGLVPDPPGAEPSGGDRRPARSADAAPSHADPIPDRTAVAAAVARWPVSELEDAIYGAGGCAAALHSIDEWRTSEQAAALAGEPLVSIDILPGAAATTVPPPGDPANRVSPPRPLQGLRVLDLTRVIAGPVAGRVLAAHGAEVLRVDGPATEDSPVLVVDTTVGKRAAVIDLTSATGRRTFDALGEQADVVLGAYRPGALAGLGYDGPGLAVRRPGIVVGTLSAYGGTGVGPRGERRGFDSLVQMTTGIADEGRRAAQPPDAAGGGPGAAPVPLPVQLLDHASGYLLAAGVLVGLTRRLDDGRAREVRVSLARTAMWLDAIGRDGSLAVPALPAEPPDDLVVELEGPLGLTRHVACPGTITGAPSHWASGPVPLGHDVPTWA